ncbi:MAG: hypothetical protein H7333_04460 [Bdellovibrionales bacterium]|nr:hypothetical protein [Oligoflexia bacterium]
MDERIFRETRFSKFLVDQSLGNSNLILTHGNPALLHIDAGHRGILNNPVAGQSMSCVACHMVGDAESFNRQGMRAYSDFTQHTAIPPLTADGLKTTANNTPTLIGALLPRTNTVLHFYGEFATIEDLIVGSYIGRNSGWGPAEAAVARANFRMRLENLKAFPSSASLITSPNLQK